MHTLIIMDFGRRVYNDSSPFMNPVEFLPKHTSWSDCLMIQSMKCWQWKLSITMTRTGYLHALLMMFIIMLGCGEYNIYWLWNRHLVTWSLILLDKKWIQTNVRQSSLNLVQKEKVIENEFEHGLIVRLKSLKAVSIMIMIFWDMMPSSSVDRY